MISLINSIKNSEVPIVAIESSENKYLLYVDISKADMGKIYDSIESSINNVNSEFERFNTSYEVKYFEKDEDTLGLELIEKKLN